MFCFTQELDKFRLIAKSTFSVVCSNFGGACFFNEHNKGKNDCVARESRGCCKLSSLGSRSKTPENFWPFCILNSPKHHSCGAATANSDKSLHQKSTLLGVRMSELGIPNQYTDFKTALGMASK